MPSSNDRSAPLPPLRRIVVLGNSQTLIVATRTRTPNQGNYAELLERRLRGRGVNAQVFQEGRTWDMINKLRPRLEPAIAQHNPDVVVLGYGMGECEPNVPPTWMMKVIDLAMWSPSLNPAASKVRRVLLPTFDKARHWAYRRIAPFFGMRTWRVGPKRFEAELERTIAWTRRQTGGLVLVQTMFTPSQAVEGLIRGFGVRVERFNTIMRTVVARLDDPDVKIVEAGARIDRMSASGATLDGLHYTPAAHDVIAATLEDAIVPWLASRDAMAREDELDQRRTGSHRRRAPSN